MSANASTGLGSEKPLVKPRGHGESPEFDITAMVDLVFMMNIFFLVTWVGAALAEIDLPPAKHVVQADPETCVIITVLASVGTGTPAVVIGEEGSGTPMTDPAEIAQEVAAAVSTGAGEGKQEVLIKAERSVPFKEIMRVAQAASTVEGVATTDGRMRIKLAVMEKK